MVEAPRYEIVITASAERSYFEVLDYVYTYHTLAVADQIALELLDYPQVLTSQPFIGKEETYLSKRKETYRYLVYHRTRQATIKIIYYVDDTVGRIYITDFFPTEMNTEKIRKRS